MDVMPVAEKCIFFLCLLTMNKSWIYIYLCAADTGWVNVASVEGSVFTYVGTESNDTVWPGEVDYKREGHLHNPVLTLNDISWVYKYIS